MKKPLLFAMFCITVASQVGALPANLQSDFNGDGRADLLWRNNTSGKNQVWLSGKAGKRLAVAPMTEPDWFVAGSGDFNGDGSADLLWRNRSTGENTIWLSANSETVQTVTTLAGQEWTAAGIADFNGDGSDDILWHNTSNGSSVIWLSANAGSAQAVGSAPSSDWRIVGTGDYNDDGKADILWRNMTTGENRIWFAADSAAPLDLSAQPDQNWQVAASADFNGDGADDILWYNHATGEVVLWPSANPANAITLTTQTDLSWVIANAADYDGDGKADILWRNRKTGKNLLWLSGDSNTPLALAARSAKKWEASDVRKVHLRTNENLSCIVNKPCDVDLVADTWGGLTPYHYQHDTFRNGTSPFGTVIDLNGHLIGTPTRTGRYKFGVCAVDIGGNFDCQPSTVEVKKEQAEKGPWIFIGGDRCTASIKLDGNIIAPSGCTGFNWWQYLSLGTHVISITTDPWYNGYYGFVYIQLEAPAGHIFTPSAINITPEQFPAPGTTVNLDITLSKQ